MGGSQYEKTINIINSIFERYESEHPDFIKKLNDLDKKLTSKNPRHVFSKEDCFDFLKKENKYANPYRHDFTTTDCLLSLYNWYKSKIIYKIKNPNYSDIPMITKDIILKLPYNSIYLDISFPNKKYCGCFVTTTREQNDFSMQYYLLLSFVLYDYKFGLYTLEPFLLTIKNNPLTVTDAYIDACDAFGWKYSYNSKYDIIACECAVSNIIRIINNLENNRKITKTSTLISSEVSEFYLNPTKANKFNVTYESKYKYKLNKLNKRKCSQKRPHVRRGHFRWILDKDKNGNIVGKHKIYIKETYIHANDKDSIVSIKVVE